MQQKIKQLLYVDMRVDGGGRKSTFILTFFPMLPNALLLWILRLVRFEIFLTIVLCVNSNEQSSFSYFRPRPQARITTSSVGKTRPPELNELKNNHSHGLELAPDNELETLNSEIFSLECI